MLSLLHIKVFINSLSTCQHEFTQSNQFLLFNKIQNGLSFTITDINSEGNNKNLLFKEGKLAKIGGDIRIPQFQIGDSFFCEFWVLVYLYESNILKKIQNGNQCLHLNFHSPFDIKLPFPNCLKCKEDQKVKHNIIHFTKERNYKCSKIKQALHQKGVIYKSIDIENVNLLTSNERGTKGKF